MQGMGSFNKTLKLMWMRRLMYDSFTYNNVSISNDKCETNTKAEISVDANQNHSFSKVMKLWNELLTKKTLTQQSKVSLGLQGMIHSLMTILFSLAWYNAGIRHVRDTFNANGQPNLFSEMVSQSQITRIFVFYDKIVMCLSVCVCIDAFFA